jgi:hypothetical protein
LTFVNNRQVSFGEDIKHTSYRSLHNTEYIFIFKKAGKRKVPYDLDLKSRISEEERKEAMGKLRNDLIPQIVAETREKGEEIAKLSVTLKPNLSKGDITVETLPLNDDSSPASPIPFPQVGESDHYEEDDGLVSPAPTTLAKAA